MEDIVIWGVAILGLVTLGGLALVIGGGIASVIKNVKQQRDEDARDGNNKH